MYGTLSILWSKYRYRHVYSTTDVLHVHVQNLWSLAMFTVSPTSCVSKHSIDHKPVYPILVNYPLPQEPDLTNIPDSATAVGLLKALFNQSRIGALVEHGLAKELCETTKSSDPISILGSKMEELAPDLRSLLKELLRVFNKVSITFIAARGSRNMWCTVSLSIFLGCTTYVYPPNRGRWCLI